MERFRGLVQRLGNVGGGGGGDDISSSSTTGVLKQLPKTKEFVDSIPRQLIIDTAAGNDAKVREALHLVHRVDSLVTSHATVAYELREQIGQLTSLRESIDEAGRTKGFKASLSSSVNSLELLLHRWRKTC